MKKETIFLTIAAAIILFAIVNAIVWSSTIVSVLMMFLAAANLCILVVYTEFKKKRRIK